MNETEITDAGLKRIVANHPRLTTLHVARTKISANGLEELRNLKELNRLEIDAGQLTPAVCRVIDSIPVRQLTIKGHSNAGVRIEGLNHVSGLRFSGVNEVAIGPNSLAALITLTCKGLSRTAVHEIFSNLHQSGELEALRVTASRQFDEPIYVDNDLMRNVVYLKSLRFFSLSGKHDVTDAGLVHLSNLTQLEEIFLHDANVTDAGAQSFSGLVNLKVLFLNGTQITNGGLMHFQNLKKLDRLFVARTGVDESGVERLNFDLPTTAIILSDSSE